MAIKLPDDIKLMASERMDDTDEGGGRMTGNEIVGGQTNNIFPDISRLDRTYGRVSLRKVYAACLSDNQDTYYGAHVIITDPPDDPNVKCTIFTTDSSTDRRFDAQDKVESFIIEGGKYIGYLWGTHLEGMRTLSIVQPIDQPPPEVGDVLCLKESDYRQFVRILEQSYDDKTFQIAWGNQTVSVRRRIVTVKISPQLKYDFHGADISPLTFPSCPSEIKRTVPTDRTDFYGVATLIEAANEGDLTVHVDSIFNEIVPAGRAETALPDATLTSEIGTGFEDALGNVYISVSGNIQSGYRVELGRPIKPSSLSVRLGSHTPWQDDGHGNLLMGDNIEGYVEYKEGIIELNNPSITGSGTIAITFTQATLRTKVAYSDSVLVTINNQSFTWIFSLYPLPEKGSVIVDFRSQQRWYRMIDDGNGSLKPLIEGTGAGTIDYTTGTVTLSTQALPDIDSEILIYWNHPAEQYEETIGGDDLLYFEIETQNKGIARNSLTITWEVDGQQKTATDDGSGNLTGDATGKVSYSDGLIWLTPLVLPDPGVEFTVEYNYGDPIVETFSAPARDGNGWLNLQLSNTPIAEHTVKVEFQACTDYMKSRTSSYTHDYFYKYAWHRPETTSEKRGFSYTADLKACVTAFWYDDGSGKLVSPDGTVTNSNIDYTSGTVSFLPDFNARFRFFAGVSSESNYSEAYKKYRSGGTTYYQDQYGWTNSWKYNTLTTANLTCVFPPEGIVKVSYYSTDGANFASETVTPNLMIDVSSGYRRRIVDGGLIFFLDDSMYWLSKGQIYRYIEGTIDIEGVGTCDTMTGDVCLQSWGIKNRDTNIIGAVKSTIDVYPVTELTFRVPGVVKPTSLILNITYIDGQNEIVTADATGEINGSRVVGYINYNTGVVKLWFGEWLSPASDYVNEEWYDPENVNENDEVWAPFAIDVEAFRYSAVLYSYIPFDPEIIGLDPTRLPPDGRVPIFRDGFVAVVHNTKSEQLPNDLQPGQQIQLSRGNLTYCDLYDYNGVYVDPNLYTVDLVNGIITMADPLDLSEYTQPLTAIHRIEDMKRISRVDISGRITFSSPLENSYTANDTYVSSALICGNGDLQGRVINVFDQKTWTGEWSDSRIGDPCTANYNTVDYPITTTNKGAIKERWAIIFTSSTDFKVVGETVGEIAYGNTATDCAPINPATGVPYFYIRHEGWGSGWASGNVLRFNTEAAHYPIWCVRTILPGKATYEEDSFTLQIRGDAH